MKPLKVVISAFGSYLGRTEIDFSVLRGSGLYLITGDTGAGKSTIFEAISYALYGETVSGSDRSASMLRNISAPDDIETYVELDFSEKGKTYHIRRSPKYSLERLKKQRKKKDGTDDTKDVRAEHSNDFLFQEVGGTMMITKEKDGDQKIEEIIGIGRENFKKIAMIAQGEFMSVIREKTEAREKILNSVFDTQNYILLTEKLKEYRSSAKSELDLLTSRLINLLRQIRYTDESIYSADAKDIKELMYLSSTRIDEAINVTDSIITEDRQLLEKTEKELAEHTRRSGEVKVRLGKAQERNKTEKLLRLKTDERIKLEKGLPELECRFAEAGDAPEKWDKLGKAAEVLKAGLGEYDVLDSAISDIKTGERDVSVLERSFEEARAAKTAAEKDEQTARTRLKELDGIESRKAELDGQYQQMLVKGKTTRRIYDKLKEIRVKQSGELKEKEQAFLYARDDYSAKKSEYDSTYEGFINNQAGMLASSLVEGKPCPVCGSVHHPEPARCESTVDKKQLDAAKKSLEKSDKALQAASEALGTEKKLIGSMIDDLKIMLSDEMDIPFTAVDDIWIKIEATLKSQRAEISEIKKQQEKTNELVAEKESTLKKREKLLKDINTYGAQLTEMNGRLHTVREKLNNDRKKADELRKKLEFESRSKAESHIRELTKQAAVLKNSYESIKKELEDHRNRISECQSVEETLKKQLEDGEKYDLELLMSEDKQLEVSIKAISELRQSIIERLGINEEIKRSAAADRDEYIEKAEYYNHCDDLYRTAGGDLKGKDSIKLLSYVQAAYFERILQRANIRLLSMSGGKYSLVRSKTVTDKRKTTGLDIDVRENKSGKCRRVDTLSGGESFMAALSMALGLSDEIQSGSGGIRLETMFIDEGFGSLDERSLDKAMEALKTLSTGDCLIGIISHVTKLREIIPRRINVTKDDNGCTLAKVEL